MIPFIRSLEELKVMSDSRSNIIQRRLNLNVTGLDKKEENSRRTRNDEDISLPDIPKANRQNWKKGKKVFEEFFEQLDYNSDTTSSSYDLTLLEKQQRQEKHEAA